MKKTFLILVFIVSILKLSSQSYYTITFQGNNTNPNTVKIENLTQSTELTINGDDILRLVLRSTAIENYNQLINNSNIYPNPMQEYCTLQFNNTTLGIVNISIYSITGKKIANHCSTLDKGSHSFILSGFSAGTYIYSIQTQTNNLSGMFYSINANILHPSIKVNSETNFVSNHYNSTLNKNNKAIVEMNFNIGDELKITGSAAGFEDVVIYNSPSNDTIYTFDFVAIFVCGNPIYDARDGNEYNTVQIGNQCWFSENLKYLPSVNSASIGSETIPYYYVYGYFGTNVNDAKATTNYNTYGVLYNWTAAMDSSSSSSINPSGIQGVCPTGWHLPSDSEWYQLSDYLGGEFDAGGKLKTTGTTHWLSPNSGATNESGFSGLPGGTRESDGTFIYINSFGYWWSTTEYDVSSSWNRDLYYHYSIVGRNGAYGKSHGFSVRCIKD